MRMLEHFGFDHAAEEAERAAALAALAAVAAVAAVARPVAAAQGKRVVPTRPHPLPLPHLSDPGLWRVAQAAGGIAISGLPANLAHRNGTYAPTGEHVDGYPSFSAGPGKHLFRHPGRDAWHLTNKPFHPGRTDCFARIPAAGGPVPTGTRAWTSGLDGGKWTERELTAREVA
jgi:hypothetical protein